MNIAEKLTTIAENEQRVAIANAELEEALYSKSEGGKTYYDEFWDALQQNGNRINYTYGFMGQSWTDTTFNPKYNIITNWATVSLFQNCLITDLEAILKRNGVVLDISNNANYGTVFAYSTITVLPEIVFSRNYTNSYNFCSGCTNLHTIRKITFTEGISNTAHFNDTFPNCTALANIEFDGILANSISLKDSPLTKASIESLINVLSDTATGKTVTLKSDAVNAAMPWDVWDELIATKPNWTFSLV